MSSYQKQPILETTPFSGHESLLCEEVIGEGYGAQWHFHPELQITYVKKSRGHKIIGDHLSSIELGEIILVGSNLPHVWFQTPSQDSEADPVHAVILRFTQDFWGQTCLSKPEFKPILQLFKLASRGITFQGQTRANLALRLENLNAQTGLQRMITFLEVLHSMANSKERSYLATSKYQPDLKTGDEDRMVRVMSYLHRHLYEEISRSTVAQVAHLSEGAFSRFFKTRTGRTLPQYINELRIGHACEQLISREDQILDVAMDCGFNNLANFNRQFLKITGFTPRDYRKSFDQGLHLKSKVVS